MTRIMGRAVNARLPIPGLFLVENEVVNEGIRQGIRLLPLGPQAPQGPGRHRRIDSVAAQEFLATFAQVSEDVGSFLGRGLLVYRKAMRAGQAHRQGHRRLMMAGNAPFPANEFGARLLQNGQGGGHRPLNRIFEGGTP